MNDLRAQGITENPADLPQYHYREDSQTYWKIQNEFVRDVIYAIYESDDDILPPRQAVYDCSLSFLLSLSRQVVYGVCRGVAVGVYCGGERRRRG